MNVKTNCCSTNTWKGSKFQLFSNKTTRIIAMWHFVLLHLGHKFFRGVFILHKGIFPCLLFNSFIPSSVGNLVHYTTFIFGHQIPLLTCIDIHVNDDVFCHPDFWQVSFLLIETLHSNELTINNDLLFYNLEYSKSSTVLTGCLFFPKLFEYLLIQKQCLKLATYVSRPR